MLVQTLLSPTAPQDFGALMDAFPSLGIETYHDEDIFVYNPNPITDAHMKKVGTDYEVRPVSQMPVPWTKAILQQDHPLLLEVQRWLLERYGHLYEAIFSNPYYLEITKKGSTKGGMVDHLVSLLGIDPGKVYCVGDNQNDIPMLARSAIPSPPPTVPKRSGTGVRGSCATVMTGSSAISWKYWTSSIKDKKRAELGSARFFPNVPSVTISRPVSPLPSVSWGPAGGTLRPEAPSDQGKGPA